LLDLPAAGADAVDVPGRDLHGKSVGISEFQNCTIAVSFPKVGDGNEILKS